jgi:AbrB family looped-hinge helix DNA binding protein
MSGAKLTSKGQITLPKSVRDRLRLGVGDRVEFVETDAGFVLRTATRDIRELKGILPRPKRPVSIETMNAAIAQMGQPKS